MKAMKALVLMSALVTSMAVSNLAAAQTVFVATPLGLIAVHSPRPVARVVVVRRPIPVCVRHFKRWQCR